MSRNRYAELSSDGGGSGAILKEDPQVQLDGTKDSPTTTKKVQGKGKRRTNKRGEKTVTYSLGDFLRSGDYKIEASEIEASDFDIEKATGLSVEPAIKSWARIPKHLKEKHAMLHKLCCKPKKGKRGKKILEASLCVTKNYEDHLHAEPVGWISPLDIKGHFQVTTDGQYTEARGGVVLKAGFGVTIRTAKAKILATTGGPSKKEPGSSVHEYLATLKGIEFAAELKKILHIKTLEVASDCEALVDRLNRMKLPGSAADKISRSNLSPQDEREFQIMQEIREMIIEHFDLESVTFIHLDREANKIADLLSREKTACRVVQILKTPELYEDESMETYTRELKELLERKEQTTNEDWIVVPYFDSWIMYFEDRDYKSSLDKKDRRTYEDNFYLRFEPVWVYDFVIEKLRHFSQPGTYGN